MSKVTAGAGVRLYSVPMSQSRLPSLEDFANAEHCVLEDLTLEQPSLGNGHEGRSEPRIVSEEIAIKDKLRGRTTLLMLYEEGWADIEIKRRGRRTTFHRIDLRYLDPVPATSRHYPIRLLKATGILAGVTTLCAIPAFFGWLAAYSVPAALVMGTLTFAVALTTYYLSHEKIRFCTLHGRADAIRFGAGLGTIRRFHKLVPKLVGAIADAAENVNDDTAVYLRAEMREHYRLRGEGVLSDEECNESTGRILGEFDGPL